MTSHSIRKTIKTPKAAIYATQLSKHFGHKIKVEELENSVVFHFAFGIGQADVDGDLLTLSAAADSLEHMQKLAHVLGSHLERFAFRENLQLDWPSPTANIEGETS